MRRGLLVLACCSLAPVFLGAQTAETYSIAGTVVGAGTGRAMGNVRVSLSPVEARDQQISLVTGADGRFQFAGLKAGKYQLSAQERNGLYHVFGQSNLRDSFSTAVVTGPGIRSEALEF